VCTCGGELVRRDDDREDAVEQRIKNYFLQTEPLIAFYKKNNLLKEVNGLGEIKTVAERIFEVLDRVETDG
jgi:adenylate kinase